MDQHKEWAMQWKSAGPRLQAIRDEELRKLDAVGAQSIEKRNAENPHLNGLVIFQKWMMRQALLDATQSNG